MCSSVVFELAEEKKRPQKSKVFAASFSTKTHVYFDSIISFIGLKVNLFPTVKRPYAASLSYHRAIRHILLD